MAKIVTMGEIMLRLSTPGNQRFSQAFSFDANYGGGEANVAVSLAHYGHEAYFVSKLPDNDIGENALRALRAENVRTDFLLRGGERLGIYFLETGSSLRPSKVIYDRFHSSFSQSHYGEYALEEALRGAAFFHFSGITVALGQSCAELVERACRIAKENGVTVCCDLNYRKKLWSKPEARAAMVPLMEYVDVLIGNEEDMEACLGYVPSGDVAKGQTDAEGYMDIFRRLHQDFSLAYVVSTLRESHSASHNGWKALLFDGQRFYRSKHYDIEPIVDRVGAGDSFAAGLIHGLSKFPSLQQALDFAVAASALKHTIPGDFNRVSEDEVLNLCNGDGSGRVSR